VDISEKQISELADAMEQITVIESMLLAKKRDVEKSIGIVSVAQKKISKVLHELTGNGFYKSDDKTANEGDN